jgi:Icc-related predicted phosphoesterase
MTRIFHTTDLHSSDLVWRKTLKSAEYYKAQVILLLGDLTGKAIVPFVKKGDSEWYANPFGTPEKFRSRAELEERKKSFRDKGLYVFETNQGEVDELRASPKKMEELFVRVMCETMSKMLELINTVVRLPPDTMIVACPGNDDVFEIDRTLKETDKVIYPIGKVVDVKGYPMISCEWVNPTPWKTPRECSEDELRKRIVKEFKRLSESDYHRTICNFHAPPHRTGLDLAPKLDKDLKPVTDFGQPVMEYVGSKAVRDSILEFQPLLGLHGHIHESPSHCKLGVTACMNPGSEYQIGVISGYVIDLDGREAEPKYWRVSG